MSGLRSGIIIVGLGASWAVCAGVVAARRLRRAEVRRAVGAIEGEHGAGSAGAKAPSAPGPRAVVAVGAALRRLSPTPDGDADAAADRRTGWAVLAGLAGVPVAPVLAAVPLVWAVAAPVLVAQRRLARREDQIHDQLPDVVDLLALTTAAGLPVNAALLVLGGRPGGPVGEALADAAAHVRHGGPTAGALDRLSAVGPQLRPLVEALAQHDRYGTPLLPALERVGIEARARRRRRAEAAARRLPVTLLLPLVLTTFPAFVLLTVVPLLAGSLGSLSLTPP